MSYWTRLISNSVDDLDIDLEAHERDPGVVVLLDQLLVLGHLLQVLLSLQVFSKCSVKSCQYSTAMNMILKLISRAF